LALLPLFAGLRVHFYCAMRRVWVILATDFWHPDPSSDFPPPSISLPRSRRNLQNLTGLGFVISTPEPSPNRCPQEDIHYTPPSLSFLFVHSRCSQSCSRKYAWSTPTPPPEGALIILP
ncbi:unnamed protein product, partial [Ectocarpus sp. 12 AP-2014]